MDTEITIKYKDKKEVKCEHLTIDRSIYKKYVDSYNTEYDDQLTKLSRRLWNCHLRATGDHECKEFFKDIYEFSKNYKDEDLEKAYKKLMKKELVEIIFQMY